MIHSSFTWARQARRSKQSGLGLVAVLLFIAVVGGLTALGFIEWRQRESIQTARQEKASLAQADAALLTFATAFHRLPCPDTDRDGLEDCAGGVQKGWFPSKTLALAGADSGVVVGQLRYIVQRGDASFDLAATVTDTWRPVLYNATFSDIRPSTATGGDYPATILTLSDLCERIKLADVAAALAVTPGMAQVTSSPARAVAYSLMHPGLADANGDGSVFDGVNGDNGNTVEDSARKPLLASYDDLVLERSFASLQSTFNCASLAQSINTVALGLDVVAQVDDMRDGNIKSAGKSLAFAIVASVITGTKIIKSIVDISSDTSNAAVEFAACVASLGIAVNFCSAAPTHVSSTVLAGGVLAANIGVLISNVVAIGLAGSALAVADKSRPASSINCPVTDLSAALATSRADLTSAENVLQALQTQQVAKQGELNNANTAKTNAVNALFSVVSGSATLTTNATDLIAAADGLAAAQLARDTAVGVVDNAADKIANLDTQVLKYDDMLANRVLFSQQLTVTIASLTAQVAAETNPAIRDNLTAQLNRARGEYELLKDPVTLQIERDKAVADRAAAVTDRDNAQAAITAANGTLASSQSQYQSNYSALNGAAGPQLIVLMGLGIDPGAIRPNANSRFSLPRLRQRELDAIVAQLQPAQKRVAQARLNVAELEAPRPPCNVAGTGVDPWAPSSAQGLLANTDAKGGTR